MQLLQAAQQHLGSFITTALAAGVGAYFGSYLKKKGENLATHEDIDKLVDQVAAVTQATKEIEARISTEVWDRQKRWELKRDLLLEATKRLAAMESALTAHCATLPKEGDSVQNIHDITERRRETGPRVVDARNACNETTSMASLVCSIETARALRQFAYLGNSIGLRVDKDEDRESVGASFKELLQKSVDARAAIRRELGIEPLSEPAQEPTSAAG